MRKNNSRTLTHTNQKKYRTILSTTQTSYKLIPCWPNEYRCEFSRRWPDRNWISIVGLHALAILKKSLRSELNYFNYPSFYSFLKENIPFDTVLFKSSQKRKKIIDEKLRSCKIEKSIKSMDFYFVRMKC